MVDLMSLDPNSSMSADAAKKSHLVGPCGSSAWTKSLRRGASPQTTGSREDVARCVEFKCSAGYKNTMFRYRERALRHWQQAFRHFDSTFFVG
jgi:hypothetical protein